MMPLKGLIDNQGNDINFGDVSQTSPKQWNMPKAYIEAISGTTRDSYCDYSSSELSSMTVRQYLLLQLNDIYVHPHRLLDRWEGISHHASLAPYGGELSEKELTMEIDGIKLGGTPDYYYQGTLIDYKTCKSYMVGWIDKAGGVINNKSKPEWCKQINLYRELLNYNGNPVDDMRVSMYSKDWSYRSKCNQIETRVVATVIDILEWATSKITDINYYKGEEKLPKCDDTWKGNIRCEHYCDVSEVCTQYTSFEYMNAYNVCLDMFGKVELEALYKKRRYKGHPTSRRIWLNIHNTLKAEAKEKG
jgi:hypothetical protein